MLVSAHRSLARRPREAFTLLEVLVVVAIIVILAGVAGVSMFQFIENAKADTARTQMSIFEENIQNYMTSHEGQPPNDLTVLVAPTEGKPLIQGGMAALTDPWGKQYLYDASHTDAYGSPDPVVSTTNPQDNNRVLYSTRRKTAP